MNNPDLSFLAEHNASALSQRYQFFEEIGRGGEAFIWSALDRAADHVVAIKLIPFTSEPIGHWDPQNEHRIIATLRHPHILPISDFGIEGELYYLVSAYLPAGSLRKRINKRPLSLSNVVEFAGAIASALDYIHRKNIVHRDLKSTNILLDFNQNLYLTDFGISRKLSSTTAAYHTGRGTALYSPPEQVSAELLTIESDIYSFGILLYEMLTSQLPWDGEKSLGVLQLSGRAELPDPRDFRPDLPPDLSTVLRQLTARRVEDRPPTATAAFEMVAITLAESGGINELPVLDVGTLHSGSEVGHVQGADVRAMLVNTLEEWPSQIDLYPLNHTNFAHIESAFPAALDSQWREDEKFRRFMLAGALWHSYRINEWWQVVEDQTDRQWVFQHLLLGGPEDVIHNLLEQLSRLDWSLDQLDGQVARRLIKLVVDSDNYDLQDKLLTLLRDYLPAPADWRSTYLTPAEDARLGRIAVSHPALSERAAEVIGQVRSLLALELILEDRDEARLISNLSTIQRTANRLPDTVPISLRLRLWLAENIRDLLSDRQKLVRAAVYSLLGGLLSFGSYVYSVYRVPSFLDVSRFLIAFERGLVLGGMVGMAVFVSRLLAQRLWRLPYLFRSLLATVLGGLLINLGVFSYYLLFLRKMPNGWLIAAGSLLLAAGYSFTIVPRKLNWLSMVVGLVVTTLVFAGSWYIHLQTSQDPVLFFEYFWPGHQIWLLSIGFSLPLAILGNWVNLSLKAG